jgi:hypothetical protein
LTVAAGFVPLLPPPHPDIQTAPTAAANNSGADHFCERKFIQPSFY